MSKQDRQGVRSFNGLEQKYQFGQKFAKQEQTNAKQDMTLSQFISFATNAIDTLQKDLTLANANISKANDDITEVNKSLDNLSSKDNEIQNSLSSYWKTVYPVGAVYISLSATSPGTLFGGTWERLEDRFLLGAGSSYGAGSTGGEAEHTLTIEEMPSHNHALIRPQWYGSDGNGISTVETDFAGAIYGTTGGTTKRYKSMLEDFDSYPAPIVKNGGDLAHNNMPPYLAVYMWKRTA